MEWLTLILLGGVLALDETSVGQFMLSRPLVAGTVAGWLLGDPTTGFLQGAVLECLYLPRLHVGGARFPDSAPAAVTAAAVAAGHPVPGTMVLALAAGLLIGALGGHSVAFLRGLTGRWVPEPEAGELSAATVEGRHLAAIALDAVRGAFVTAVGVVLIAPLAIRLADGWPASPETAGLAITIMAAIGLGMLWARVGGGRREMILFALGAAASLGVVL